MDWFRLTLSPDPALSSEEIDEACCELIENGASGTTIEASGAISCFVSGGAEDVSRIEALATHYRLAIKSRSKVEEENWSGQCSELWQPVSAGALTVIPVESVKDDQEINNRTIRIIPGQGFGTGHHPTTRMILEALSRYSENVARSDLSIFDLGTGSGILAIAAAKLLNRPVVAIDNDPYAIANAIDNVSLNGLSHLITPSTTPIEELTGPFDLILANLYGEVLVTLAPHVDRLTQPGARTVMSGVTELVRDVVVDAYVSKGTWVIEEEQSDSAWHCLVLRKPPVA